MLFISAFELVRSSKGQVCSLSEWPFGFVPPQFSLISSPPPPPPRPFYIKSYWAFLSGNFLNLFCRVSRIENWGLEGPFLPSFSSHFSGITICLWIKEL